MRPIFLIVALFIFRSGFTQERNFEVSSPSSCDNLPSYFENADAALSQIETVKFNTTESFRINRKRGLTSGQFYSCDNKTGFLVLEIDGQKVIYRSVEKTLWNELTSTNDPEGFIYQRIKLRYTMIE